MIETHPFGVFVPPHPKYLILGSFPGQEASDEEGNPFNWFYGTKRNQFWSIIEEVYGVKLKNRDQKRALLTKLGIAITDIIYSCERQKSSNLDLNLVNIVYNFKAITKILRENKIKKIFFSSRFVETNFKRKFKDLIKQFPEIELITLPSPSPRFASMTKQDKIEKYRQLLPTS